MRHPRGAGHCDRVTTPRIFAHRGASGLLPENTRSAFIRALDDGADGIELDVHLTADGEVVCIHDHTLDRTTNGVGPVSEHTLTEIQMLDASGWKISKLPPQHAGVQIMSLTEVIDLVEGLAVELAIELKHPSPFGRELDDEVLAVLYENGYDAETSSIGSTAISLMSFDPSSVARLAEHVPSHALCVLWTTEPSGLNSCLATEAMDLVAQGKAGIAGSSVGWCLEQPNEARRLIEAGARLRTWTVNDIETAGRLLDLGVHELTGDFPHRLVSSFRGT